MKNYLTLDATFALHHMRRALRRGELEKVERWQKVLERSVRIQQRFGELELKDARLNLIARR